MSSITYADYLNEFPDHMTIGEAGTIYRQLYGQLDFRDEDISEFFDLMVSRAKDYADMRYKWSVMEMQDRLAEDDDRTQKHNAYLNALSMLRTVLSKKGKAVDWFEMLGDDIQKKNRKRAGDFACFLVLFRSLSER